jgi:hypothetical protein
MRRLTRTVSLAVVLLILHTSSFVLFGQDAIESNPPTNSATAKSKDYTLTIQTDKAAYDPGEKIAFKMTLKYTGAAPVGLSMDPGPVYRRISVFLKDRPCPETLHYKQVVGNDFNYGHGIEAPPGYEESHTVPLNRLFDMTLLGEYKIFMRWEDLKAGPVTIRIRDSGLKE